MTAQLALPHVGMVKQNMVSSQSHNAPPMATCVLVRHSCVLLHITSMQTQLRLHVASGSVKLHGDFTSCEFVRRPKILQLLFQAREISTYRYRYRSSCF